MKLNKLISTIAIFIASVSFLLPVNSARAQAIPIDGNPSYWNSSQGEVILRIFGPDVFGTYTNDNGRISGTFRQNAFDGFWAENSSGTKCVTPKMDSFYWGRIRWTFTPNGFNGQWSYCDGELSGSWSGRRATHASTTTIAPYQHPNMPTMANNRQRATPTPNVPGPRGTTHWTTTEGFMTAIVTGNQFKSTYRGSYEGDNGRMEGTLTGNVFEGYWGENQSLKECATERLGTYYWGRIRLVFNGGRFSGQWSYCDLELGGEWVGVRAGH